MGILPFVARHRALYLRYTLVTIAGVLVFASLQMSLFLGSPQPRLFPIPVVLGLVVGLLLSTVVAMRLESLEKQKLFRAVADLAQEFIYVRRKDGVYDYVSPSCIEVTGYPPEDFYRTPNFMSQLVLVEDRDTWDRHVHQMHSEGRPEKLLVRIRHPDGSVRWLEHLCSDVRDERGDILGVRSTNLDVTGRVERERELAIAATAFESSEAIVITDAAARIQRVNRAFSEITGFPPEEAIGQTPAILKSGRHEVAFYEEMWAVLMSEGQWRGEIWDRRRNGEIYPKQLAITAVRNAAGQVVHYVGSFSDISARKEAEAEINRLAFYDPLTQLPNRRLLMDRLRLALAATNRHGSYGALLLLDVDNFKTLNDTRGHDVGDQLLIEVAHCLAACVRAEDTVARLGGDEFVLMLENLGEDERTAAAHVETVVEKVLAAVNQPCSLKGCDYQGSSSIGATLFRGQEESIDDLLKHADVALYRAKGAGRATFCFFDPHMQAALEARAALESDLRQALAGDQLRMHFQPQMDSAGRLRGAEVLIRWQHPGRGLVSPAEFIPFAEESGMIIPIGRWLLEEVVRQLDAWTRHPVAGAIQLAVNVSARQFQQPQFVDDVLATLALAGVAPGRLKVELTESILIERLDETVAKLSALKQAGVGISLDDFGTGYSSLSYLKRLPIDQLKIDRSFICDFVTNINDAVIVQTIIGMAGNLGLEVIAEGVETGEQVDLLERNGCHLFQGYYFSRPLPLDQFAALLERL